MPLAVMAAIDPFLAEKLELAVHHGLPVVTPPTQFPGRHEYVSIDPDVVDIYMSRVLPDGHIIPSRHSPPIGRFRAGKVKRSAWGETSSHGSCTPTPPHRTSRHRSRPYPHNPARRVHLDRLKHLGDGVAPEARRSPAAFLYP